MASKSSSKKSSGKSSKKLSVRRSTVTVEPGSEINLPRGRGRNPPNRFTEANAPSKKGSAKKK